MTEKIADSFELSPQQEQLWLAEPDGPKGAVQVVLALKGRLDADALTSALRRASERHEILRTTFPATSVSRSSRLLCRNVSRS